MMIRLNGRMKMKSTNCFENREIKIGRLGLTLAEEDVGFGERNKD